jgi:maltooligosyltrehalose trehalohydrolase
MLLQFYKELIRLRKLIRPIAYLEKEVLDVIGYDRENVLFLRRRRGEDEIVSLFNLGDSTTSLIVSLSPGNWHKLIDSAEERWTGPGTQIPQILASGGNITTTLPPQTFVLFILRKEL